MGGVKPGAGAVYRRALLAGRRGLRENLMQYIQQPQAIEAKSFDIISRIIARNATGLPFRQPAARGDYQAGDPHHR
ncbi:hypothetical protein LNQ52_14770 [Klebsiella pneumoniae subsp. pneumoniae]|nr:hypothetical protein [Klebsiella pneumoniae subsp. pneumoniae]